MTPYQRVWWEQVRSDARVLALLRERGAAHCHQLHYLQMVTEKLSKAYLWRPGNPPPLRHRVFVQFLKALRDRSEREVESIARLLGFGRAAGFVSWARASVPLVRRVEQLAPDLANDGPNPEYPWPQAAPTAYPADHTFAVWNDLKSGRGRQLLDVIDAAVREFPKYA